MRGPTASVGVENMLVDSDASGSTQTYTNITTCNPTLEIYSGHVILQAHVCMHM